ncbi:MurR/RpiR family transcriptional regulator [Mesorhizobium sp. M1C.F.Ca.ET.193.01.1.1]|uniref:MurR/RpiR family transcriptional regulator n=1 Tax=unclassified Mesorhizobium TaxID=325217 RepID=UPI000FD22A25|nr:MULTISPECIES: MurR/RpiR family transcriptional regulator [unclassified Mesorhizobium]TGS94515.1 MurR/RpiR family transcriptional regulator [bacterium M00.F.Ca.ET.177.01.1.1]TGQ51217.1 MurR/RpiR family transcriptional regulator [Mesorhizobium sp. M1C.F.Ca.ET.210.01.1.1]TGQ67005.1 MurR/RpiR family transcriptional regulator [Mesorhizobium sp. M1C.F.Ca.ET.212.01.1.1]TGR01128.1 MurR/RpiR family transcriptional regulator [Mesorhizobium sp. M1C.F.Ca.ET.204.01.1.1]TGR21807.1 MurR/RpiR family transc
MISSIAELISDRIGTMPAGERRAAQTLIANYPLTGLKTVAEFSAAAGVSSPTILRFVARLGFQNYPEFQSALQDELAAQLQSPASRTLNPASPVGGGAVSPMLEATLQNMRETFRHLSDKQLADIATRLAERRGKTFLIGGRFTDPLARYMAAHLAIIQPDVYHLAGQESIWRDRLIDMGKRDVLVIFDIRRYQESLVRFAEKAHQRGVQIVLFTDQWLSPIARFARHVIAGRTAVPSAWDSSAALFVVAETLIGAVTRQLEAAGAKRIRDLESLR